MHTFQLNLPGDGALKVHLNRSSYFTVPAREPMALEVLIGCAWVTQEGDYKDHFLCKGERFNLPGHGEAIVQAMRESEIAVFPRAVAKPLGLVGRVKQFAADLLRPDTSSTSVCSDTVSSATQCWRNHLVRQSATRLGLERTF